MKRVYEPLNIYCASCGAPAKFDVARQLYRCAHCGGETGIDAALEEKKGFRRLHRDRLEQAKHPTEVVSCTGCGATVVFPEGEALQSCAFCGRSLVRREYLAVERFPELLIPFRIEHADAKRRLLDWCERNRRRPEARILKRHADELQGFYLPYELVKGPSDCTVRRNEAGRAYQCRGYLDGIFVNTSSQLDNHLLNGMEPYDLSDVREFDFSYLAGQRVKIADVDGESLAARVRDEIAGDYEPMLAKSMETRAIHVSPDTGNLLQLSVVLPAYFLRAENVWAAVNGQTGKVAVRECRDRFLAPWWWKPLAATAALAAIVWGVTSLFTAEWEPKLLLTGMLTAFFLIVLLTAYHNQYEGTGRFRLRRRIFTSDDTRQDIAPPAFYAPVGGTMQPVRVRFTTPLRMLRMLALALGVVFLPLILAWILNGCSAQGLTPGGAAVWLCITVPIAPVYLLKFGRLDLYEHPLVDVRDDSGRWKRVREQSFGKRLMELCKTVFSPPVLIGVLIALGILIINVVLVLHWDDF